MHDAAQEALIILPEWNDIAIVAEGDERLLHHVSMLGQMPIQAPPDPLTRMAELATNLLQPWARTTLNLATQIHHLADPPFDRLRSVARTDRLNRDADCLGGQ